MRDPQRFEHTSLTWGFLHMCVITTVGSRWIEHTYHHPPLCGLHIYHPPTKSGQQRSLTPRLPLQPAHTEMQTLYVSWAISPRDVRQRYNGTSNTESDCTAITSNPAALPVTSCYTPLLQCPNTVKHLSGHTGSICGLISAQTLPQKSHEPGWWEKQSGCDSFCANFWLNCCFSLVDLSAVLIEPPPLLLPPPSVFLQLSITLM